MITSLRLYEPIYAYKFLKQRGHLVCICIYVHQPKRYDNYKLLQGQLGIIYII